ncbi:MAG: TonB-dependent receptor [Acidobacteria bacterium]|nr:TonB-dependent receptor [Acidobacteriota bacterium]
MRLNKAILFCLCLTLCWVIPTSAQDFRGRINGTVTDNTGAVLPGVTITATSPALIQPQVQVSSADGQFRFIALPPGVYTIDFELAGFQNVKREGVRVVINQTLTVDQALNVATLQETVTVTGASPIVDTSTTQVGTNFTKELLTEIPSARDIWAAMAQAPGMQMSSFDVGGSRSGSQTGFLAYGFGDQNQTKLEGIDTTEGTSGNAGYFDFGSFEEFQMGGAGTGADSFGGGTNMSITVKSGGDRFTGNFYGDWQGDSTISDNVPDAFRTARQKDDDGYYSRSPLTRGNPIDRQYDVNFNVGGPLWKQKAWFFYSYRINDQYKYTLGIDTLARSKLTNNYTFKGTFQLNRNNQLIGFLNKRNKLQDLRDLGPLVPESAARYQASRNYPWKWEWTSVLGSKAFLDVIAGNWYNFFPLRPTDEYGLASNVGPGRLDTQTSQRSGYHDSYQDQKRFKPQVYVSLAYFKDGWMGSHDFKVGYDWKRDRRHFFRDQPGGNIFYRDLNGAVNELELYNAPNTSTNDVVYNAGHLSDTWKMTDRLTLNLGIRFEHYLDSYPEQSFTPGGHTMLTNWPADLNPAERARYQSFIAPVTSEAREVARTFNVSPRIGFAYDLFGDNRTVLKGFYGRFYFNSADTLADLENPVGSSRLRYRFNDLNGNRLLDSAAELGAFVSNQGGAGFVNVDDNIKRPYSQEFSTHLEREIIPGLSGRASYVYKNVRDEWVEIDPTRAAALTIPFTFVDIGADGVRGTADDATLNLVDRPVGTPQTRLYTNPTDPAYNSDFQTVEFAINRRFAGRWMLLTSFGYTWLDQFHATTTNTGANDAISQAKTYNWRINQRMFGDNGKETSTLWNYKVVGRYTMPWEIGFSGSWKTQSGRQWGRNVAVTFPGDGQQSIRVEPVTSHRAPTVTILDVRADKSFSFGKFGKATFQVDVFNALNRGTVTNFQTVTGGNYLSVLGLLDPRIVRFGFRYDF